MKEIIAAVKKAFEDYIYDIIIYVSIIAGVIGIEVALWGDASTGIRIFINAAVVLALVILMIYWRTKEDGKNRK